MLSHFVTRRSVLQTAAGLGLSFLLPPLPARAATRRRDERPKSLIMLWMSGGPSQLESWDPHPGTSIGGETKAIRTSMPGLRISDFLPRMAEEIHSLSVIRSLVSKEGDHDRGTYFVKSGFRPDPTVTHPSLGAILTRELPDSGVEIPMHVSLCADQHAARGGYLGDQLDAFKVFDPGRSVQNMHSQVRGNEVRQKRRLKNLDVLSRSFSARRRIPAEETLHQDMIDRALVMMSSEQLQAFEIDREPEATIESYGDSTFGRGCLVARRLVESGVRAVEVTLNGFDTHINNHEGQKENCEILDPAFASLVRDLRERDLLDSTILLCIGEFGRTPRINPTGGRDHWPNGFSCVVGGGGLVSGQILGATSPDETARGPADPVLLPNLYATILTAMGLDPEHQEITPIGRPMAWTDEGMIIDQLLPRALRPKT